MRSHLAGSLMTSLVLCVCGRASVCLCTRLKQREGEKLLGINVIEFWWERLMEQWFHLDQEYKTLLLYRLLGRPREDYSDCIMVSYSLPSLISFP